MDAKAYGKTTEEADADHMFEARQIVATILDYGVTQSQIVRIIKLLGLELENHDDLKKIVDVAKSIERKSAPNSIIT